MTTRPTDEEIRVMILRLREASRRMGSILSEREASSMLEAWLAERQAARGGVTDEMVEKFVELVCKHSNEEIDYVDVMTPRIRDAIQSIAQPIKSVSDALNFLEEWSISGGKLSGDDIQRFRATVERIAPIAQPVMVPEEKEDLDPVKLHRQGRFATEFERGFNEGWNDCREAMLSAAPAYNGKKEG